MEIVIHEKESSSKKMRTVRLEPHIDEKMCLVAERLGMNVNAYLVARIGEAVNRDYLAFELAQNQRDAMQGFFSQIIDAAREDSEKDNLNGQ
jgi:hypothetical protein